LLQTADFERIRKEGARWRGRLCALNAARAFLHSPARVGYVTSKKVGGAVQRNRARRLMREAVRELRTAAELPAGWDLVLIAHTAMTVDRVGMAAVKEEIRWLLKRMTQNQTTA
jgi:ribonuclease P protein component